MMMELDWSDINLDKITKGAWDAHILNANKIGANAVKLHSIAKSSDTTGTPDALYRDLLRKYEFSVEVLSLVSPSYIKRFCDAVERQVSFLHKKLDKLLGLLESTDNRHLSGQFVSDLTHYEVLYDQMTILMEVRNGCEQAKERHHTVAGEDSRKVRRGKGARTQGAFVLDV